MAVVQSFTIDLLKPNYNYFRVVQQDSIRSISLYLYAGGATYNVASELGSGETLLTFVEYRRSDGVRRMYDTTSTGTPAVTQNATLKYLWTVALDADCFAVPGWTQINVRFETESGKRLHTFAIMAEVEATACSDSETADWNGLNSIADIRTGVSDAAQRLNDVESDVTGIEGDVGDIETRLSAVELSAESLDGRVDAIEESTDRVATFVANIALDPGEEGVDYSLEPETPLEEYLSEIYHRKSLPPRTNPLNVGAVLMSLGDDTGWVKPLDVMFAMSGGSGSDPSEPFCSKSYEQISEAYTSDRPINAYYSTRLNNAQAIVPLQMVMRTVEQMPDGPVTVFHFSSSFCYVSDNDLTSSVDIACAIYSYGGVDIIIDVK